MSQPVPIANLASPLLPFHGKAMDRGGVCMNYQTKIRWANFNVDVGLKKSKEKERTSHDHSSKNQIALSPLTLSLPMPLPLYTKQPPGPFLPLPLLFFLLLPVPNLVYFSANHFPIEKWCIMLSFMLMRWDSSVSTSNKILTQPIKRPGKK